MLVAFWSELEVQLLLISEFAHYVDDCVCTLQCDFCSQRYRTTVLESN